MEVESQPRETPETLYPIPKPQQKRHLPATLRGTASSLLISPLFFASVVIRLTCVPRNGVSETASGFRRFGDDVEVSMVNTRDGPEVGDRWLR